MRRHLEAALVVIALVIVPLGVALVARSEPGPPADVPSAISLAQQVLRATSYTATGCEWRQQHTTIYCTLKGGGSCSLQTTQDSGTCSTKP